MSIFVKYLKLWDVHRDCEEQFRTMTALIPHPSHKSIVDAGEEFDSELVLEVWKSESKRKETIESKANVLIGASMTALSVVTFIVGNSKPQNSLSKTQNIVIDCLFSAAALSWLAAGIFAFATTKVSGLHAYCVEFSDAWKSLESDKVKRAKAKYLHLCCEANVARLRQKANLLYVAQRHFIEAFIILGATVPLLLTFKMYQLNKSAMAICTHPLVAFVSCLILLLLIEIFAIAVLAWPYNNASSIRFLSRILWERLFRVNKQVE